MTGPLPPDYQGALFSLPNGGGQDSDDLPGVVVYRLGEVEKALRDLSGKFDKVAQFYVSNPTLMLMLEPLKEKIKELEAKEQSRDNRKIAEQGQLKLAIIMAILAPILTVIINVLILKDVGG